MPDFIIKIIFIAVMSFLWTGCDSGRNTKTLSIHDPTNASCKLLFSGDSGFVTKKQGLCFLLANSLTDTANSFWNQAQLNDTIGKYYKVPATGHYLYCSVDLAGTYSFETHLLMELNNDGSLIKTERYFHGNYSCCWDNYYNGFQKSGNYFGIKTCGTGSGYCASHLYLFRSVLPQSQQRSIPESYWNSSGGLSYTLNSTLELKSDNLLTMHYVMEVDTIDERLDVKPKRTTSVDVDFVFKTNAWITNDSAKLKDLRLVDL